MENFAIFMLLLLLNVPTFAQQQVATVHFKGDDLYPDVVKYVDFGIHRTGTEGDNHTSEWIKGMLDKIGFKTEYVPSEVEQFFRDQTELKTSGRRII